MPRFQNVVDGAGGQFLSPVAHGERIEEAIAKRARFTSTCVRQCVHSFYYRVSSSLLRR